MKILCKKCGQVLAEHIGSKIILNGQHIPTQGLEGITFKCICKRARTYHIRHEQDEDFNKNTVSSAFFT